MMTGQVAALVGIVATLVGTFVAYLFIPQNPGAKGALVVPALCLALGILAVPLIRLASRSPKVLNAENFVALGFVYWILLDPMQGAYDLLGTSDDAIELAVLAVGLSAAAMWAGTLGRPWPAPRNRSRSPSCGG